MKSQSKHESPKGSFSKKEKKCYKLTTPSSCMIQHTSTKLNVLFFSTENRQLLQDMIRYRVFQITEHVIAEQSPEALLIILRSIYLSHAQHLLENITVQIKRLNELVCDYTVPQITSEISSHFRYQHDISKPRTFPPQAVATRESKQLPLPLLI